MNVDMEARLLGRQVAIEVAVQDVNGDTTVGATTIHRTGGLRGEIDSADNGDYVP